MTTNAATPVLDYKNSVDHREYANDIPPQTELGKRIAVAVLPFLGLHSALRNPLNVFMDSARVWNSKNTMDRTLAGIALVSTVFKHPLGQILTTLQDIILEVKKLNKCRSHEEASKSLIKILNHLLYVALVTQGGLGLSTICIAIQGVVGLIQARDEFKNDRWIEGCANLLMSCIRLQQLHTQCQQLKKNGKAEALLTKSDFPRNESEAKKYAQDFMAKYGLPTDAQVSFDASANKITVIWKGRANMNIFKQKYPQPFHKTDWLGCPVEKAKLEFSSDQPISLETVYFGSTGWGKDFASPNFLIQKGVVSCGEDNLAINITKTLEVADFPENHKLYDW
jgi:hypothetical protein